MVEGWLFDCYPSKDRDGPNGSRPGGMTFWIKTADGHALKLRDRNWHARIYASGSACDDVDYLLSRAQASWLVRSVKTVYKIDNIYQKAKHPVLEIELKEEDKARKLAELLENAFPNPATFSLYNVDVLPEQQYFYDKELFPLAFVRVKVRGDQVSEWELRDSVASTDYSTPDLKCLQLNAQISDRVPTFHSKLDGIALSPLDNYATEEEVVINGSEPEILSETVGEIEKLDPDILVTRNGDAFVLPFLYAKASNYSINLKLNRDRAAGDYVRNTAEAKTYFSYGKIMYRPATQRLFGRLHLDEENTFVYDQCRLQGLYEVSRLCRMPFHTSMRASIGKCLSGLQFYYAAKREILIPWKPKIAEDFKSGYDLLLADRGGLVLEPLPGAFEHVGELDFASLYPSIIRNYNISVETVNCGCCSFPETNPQGDDGSKNSFEDLGIHICEKETGIVAQSLQLPLSKRFRYKELRDGTKDKELKKIYNERAGSLKWILVCCLARESPVLVQRDGLVAYAKIGDFIDNIVGEKEGVIDCISSILVAGAGNDLKSKFCKIQKLIKIPRHGKLLSVSMDDGRKIITTSDHPFYVLKKGKLQVRLASDLKENDLVPVAKRISGLHHEIEVIDVIERLTKSVDRSELARWRVSSPILSQMILEKKEIILEQSMKEGYSNQAVGVWIKTGMIPLLFFHLLNVPLELRSKLRIGIGGVRGMWGRTSWIPAIIPVSEELGFFLGLYVSDGSTTDTYIRLDIGYYETDLLENARQITESLFQTTPHIYKETNVNMYVLQINNLAIVKFLEQVLNLPNTAEKGKLKVPEIIFNSDRSTARGFLGGLLAGNGSIDKARNFASIATVSKEFANQIGFLAAILGLGFGISVHSRLPINPIYTVNLVGPETLREITQWRFLKKAHYAILEPKLESLCNGNCAHPVYHLFPIEESNIVLLAREARTVRTPRIDLRDNACPYRLAQTIGRISSRKISAESMISLENVKQLFESDLGFVSVRKIEELDREDKHVYCFQLADDELPGFFTGEGAVYTHNCFGYLSYRNAKFGKIDSHIAVCAMARKTLLEAMHFAEYRGFNVIHGIVDSLWLSKRKAKKEDYLELCKEIEESTRFKIALEGIYKWIVFLPSKIHSSNQVANRYFGCFEETNEIKVRGIELRRHDTPPHFNECQNEILYELSACNSIFELKEKARTAGVEIFRKYSRRLERHDVSAMDLVIRRRLSKELNTYSSKRQLSVSAAGQLARDGLQLRAGQTISYVITKYKSSGQSRAVPEELIHEGEYDSQRYIELLADCCATVLSPFGITKEFLLSRAEPLLL